MRYHVTRWMRPLVFVALMLATGLGIAASGQRAPFATPPPGSGPTPMEPYGQSGGCSEEPKALHRCALEKAKTFNPPRTPEGVPNFQGIWNRIGARNAENIQEHAKGEGSGGTSLIMDPPDGLIPYQAWAKARVDTHYATYWNPTQHCMPSTPPRMQMTGGANEILQTPGFLFFIAENGFRSYRVIPTTPLPPLGSNIHLHVGASRGRWEGNTLVVEVDNMKDRFWLDAVGDTFSESAHLVERWTMFHQDAIHYEVTITDPTVFTRPWTMAFGWKRSREQEILESACWEGIQDSMRRLKTDDLKMYEGGFRK